jgi:hypothetical protein
MSKVYAARSVAKKHIMEQCENCNLKKNSNGLYNHDNIVKVQETIEGKLNEVFLDHDSGYVLRQTILRTQIKLSTYSNVLSVFRNGFICAGRNASAYLHSLPPAITRLFLPF